MHENSGCYQRCIGYLRTFNQPIKSADSDIYRRIARFKKVNSIGGN